MAIVSDHPNTLPKFLEGTDENSSVLPKGVIDVPCPTPALYLFECTASQPFFLATFFTSQDSENAEKLSFFLEF